MYADPDPTAQINADPDPWGGEDGAEATSQAKTSARAASKLMFLLPIGRPAGRKGYVIRSLMLRLTSGACKKNSPRPVRKSETALLVNVEYLHICCAKFCSYSQGDDFSPFPALWGLIFLKATDVSVCPERL